MNRWLNREIFPLYYTLILNQEDWDREVKECGFEGSPYPTSDGKCTHLMNYKELHGEVFIVTLNKKVQEREDRNSIAALITHEAVHIVDMFLKAIGEKKPGYEIRAYMTQWVTLCLLDEFDRQRKKMKKKEKKKKENKDG